MLICARSLSPAGQQALDFQSEEYPDYLCQNYSYHRLQYQSNGNLLQVEFKKQEETKENAEASKYRIKEDLLEEKVNFLILILKIF